MKFCPVCRQKYDDAQNFCLDDGTTLEFFFAEAQVETVNFKNDSAINQTSPTIVSPKQVPLPNQDTITDLYSQTDLLPSALPKKSNSLQIALLSILGTLGVIGIAGGAWWLGNRQAANEIAANTSANSTQKSSGNSKTNDSSSSPTPNQTEIAQSNQKSANGSNAILTAPTNSKTENTAVTPTPSGNSTEDVQVRLTNLGKSGNSPYPGGSINIQILGGKILTGVTNNAGVASFKDVPCGKPLRISVSCEDGSGVFPRSLKCGANASWNYQVNCFLEGKTGGCAIEQVK
jgi:hypothetical protein